MPSGEECAAPGARWALFGPWGELLLASYDALAHGAWPEDVWAWSPRVGRWKPDYGRPKYPVYVAVSTDAVSRHEAYDFWRDIAYYSFDADPRPPGGTSNFRARGQALITPAGELYVYRSSAVTGRRTARQIRSDGGSALSVGMVLAGVRRHRDERDDVTVAGPGRFFCYDATRVARVAWEEHQGVHVTLPRTVIGPAVGGPLPPVGELVRLLHRSRLAPFLRIQLHLVAQQFGRLTPRERAAVFDATVDLILSALREAVGNAGDDAAEADLGAYFAAARRVILERIADPDLTPETIAAVLRCSRATLYRAFSARGMTVARYIREVRLQEAWRRIAHGPAKASIGDIAAQCGFLDAAYFRRLFRERFDMNPSDVRDLAPGPVPVKE